MGVVSRDTLPIKSVPFDLGHLLYQFFCAHVIARPPRHGSTIELLPNSVELKLLNCLCCVQFQ